MPIIVRHDGSPLMAGLDAAAGAAASAIGGQSQGMGGLNGMLMQLAQAQMADQAAQRQFDRNVQMVGVEDKAIRGRSQEAFDRERNAQTQDREREMQDAANLAMVYGERYGTMPPPGLMTRKDVDNWVSIMESDRSHEDKLAEAERLYGRSTNLGGWYLRAAGYGNGAGAGVGGGAAGGGVGAGVGAGVAPGMGPGVGTVRTPGGGVAGFVHQGMQGAVDGTGGYAAAAGSDPHEMNAPSPLPPGYGVFPPGMAPGERQQPGVGMGPGRMGAGVGQGGVGGGVEIPPGGVPLEAAKSLVDDLRMREHDAAMERMSQEKIDAARAIAKAKALGANISPEDEDLAATYLVGIRTGTLSPEQDSRARVWLKSHKLLSADDMVPGPSPQAVAEQKQAAKELERMEGLLKSFDQKNSEAARNYATEHGLMMPSKTEKENGQPKMVPDKMKARAHLQQAIEAQKKIVGTATAKLGSVPDPTKSLSKEDFNLMYDALIPGGETK